MMRIEDVEAGRHLSFIQLRLEFFSEAFFLVQSKILPKFFRLFADTTAKVSGWSSHTADDKKLAGFPSAVN